MKLKTIVSCLVNLEILCYIIEQKKCSANQLLKLFEGKIVRRTLYDALEKWDLEEKVIVRDDFEDKQARYSHFTIKPTQKLVDFFQNQLYAFLSSIFRYNLKLEVSDGNLHLLKDFKDS